MPADNIPLYLDWSFWAVVVAAVAIVLSQLPPVHLLLRRGKLDIEPYSRILITHKIGNPNVQLHIILTNIGGRLVRVKSIELKIKRDGKDIATLPAQNYLQNPTDTNNVLFTSFSIKPREEWAHIVNFLNYFSREDEKKYRTAESKLREDILEKVKRLKNKDHIVKAEDNLVTPFIEMFNEKFVWQPGEYELSISVIASNNKSGIAKSYRFTLFESDSQELIKHKEDYKTGDGIFWYSP